MLENPNNVDLCFTVKTPTNSIKRCAQRRKSGGDRLQLSTTYANEGEKNQIGALRNAPIADHHSVGGSILAHENPGARLISLCGCCDSEAFQLLNDRWIAAMNAYSSPNPSADLAERPIMYSGSGASACGHFKLPHQLISRPASVAPSGLCMDFLSELRRAMQNANPKELRRAMQNANPKF